MNGFILKEALDRMSKIYVKERVVVTLKVSV